MTRTILAFPADCHSGSTVGLMRDKPWQLDTGGTYHPSRAQKIIWKQWTECWEVIRNIRNTGDRLIITMMGDAVDGKHNETSELITARIEEQERIYIDAMDYALNSVEFDGNKDVLQFISGTPAHVGEMAQSERRICEDLNGRGIYDRLKFEVDGIRFDCAHDGIAVGNRAWTDDNSLRLSIKSMLYQALITKDDPPHYVIRAHRHRFTAANYARGNYEIMGVICPAFQLKTTYSERFSAMSMEKPDIGMFIVVVDDGVAAWQCPRIKWARERWEKL